MKIAVGLLIGVLLAAVWVNWAGRSSERQLAGVESRPTPDTKPLRAGAQPESVAVVHQVTSEEGDLDDIVGVAADPFSSLEFHVGPLTLDELKLRYFSSIEAARQGDTEAMRVVSHVLLNCQHAWYFPDTDTAWSNFENGLMSLTGYEETSERITECEPIAKDVLEEFPDRHRAEIATRIAHEWLARSAEAGNRSARLELLSDLPGQGVEIAALLDELLDAKDPQALFKAAEFESLRSRDGYAHLSERWAYLGCINHDACDARLFKDRIERTYTPTEQYEIVSFAENFESLAKSEISFKEILVNQPYTAYTPQEIEFFKNYVDKKGAADKVGDSVFWED